MYRLLEKHNTEKTQFQWSTECERACQKLKEQLCRAPILAFPNFDEPFILTTDASLVGIGGPDTKFCSRRKTNCIFLQNTKYSRTELSDSRTRAIVSAVKHFRLYLQGKFLVRMDHKGLTWLYSQKNITNRRLASWLMYIQQYDFDVQYIPGTDVKMQTANLLNRQGHEARVQRLQSNKNEGEGTPQITSIFGDDEFAFTSWKTKHCTMYGGQLRMGQNMSQMTLRLKKYSANKQSSHQSFMSRIFTVEINAENS